MRVAAVAAWVCLSVVEGCVCAAADASAPIYKLSIDKQSLDTALTALAQQTGLQIGRFSDAPKLDTPAGPIVGNYTADEALRLLLSGTGLSFKSLNERAFIVLTPRDAKRENDAQSMSNCAEQISGEREMRDRHGCARRWSYLLAGALGVAAAPSSHAQTPPVTADGLEEVVVTAERRTESLQRTAVSISVRSGADLQNLGRYSLAQILEDVPGVSGGAATNVGNSSGSDVAGGGLTIRGIPSNAGAGTNVTSLAPAAAVYVDGVYEGVGGGYDIDRVEVLRGPQGTLYGRSATSGLIASHTFDPDLARLSGNAALEFGDYALQHYTAAVNVPLVDDVLGIRVAGNRYERDGYDSAEGGALASTDGKVKILYRPSENFSLLLGAAMQDNATHYGGVSITLDTPDSYAYTDNIVGSGENQFRQYWAQLDWNLGPVTLTYLPAYRSWESQMTLYQRDPLLLPLDQNISTPKDHFHTEELRLASNAGSTVSWQVGALYYENDLANQNRTTIYPLDVLAYSSDIRSKSTEATGIFGEATYALSESWRVTAGVRYDDTEVAVDQAYTSATLVTKTLSGDEGTRRFHNVTYKGRIEHDLTAQNLLYASISTGFTPGDITAATGTNDDPIVFELKAETLTAYEIGSKNRFLGKSLQINGAVYYYDYEGYHTVASVFTASGLPTSVPLSSPAQVFGGELETLYQLTPNDRIGLNLAYTNARFVDKTSSSVTLEDGTSRTFADFFTKDAIPESVPFTASLSYAHTFDLPGGSLLTMGADGRYLSAYDGAALTPTQVDAGLYPFIRVDDQFIGNLNVGWTSSSENYSVTGYVRNVGDNRYKTEINVATTNSLSVTPYDPRTYGIVLSARFGN